MKTDVYDLRHGTFRRTSREEPQEVTKISIETGGHGTAYQAFNHEFAHFKTIIVSFPKGFALRKIWHKETLKPFWKLTQFTGEFQYYGELIRWRAHDVEVSEDGDFKFTSFDLSSKEGGVNTTIYGKMMWRTISPRFSLDQNNKIIELGRTRLKEEVSRRIRKGEALAQLLHESDQETRGRIPDRIEGNSNDFRAEKAREKLTVREITFGGKELRLSFNNSDSFTLRGVGIHMTGACGIFNLRLVSPPPNPSNDEAFYEVLFTNSSNEKITVRENSNKEFTNAADKDIKWVKEHGESLYAKIKQIIKEEKNNDKKRKETTSAGK